MSLTLRGKLSRKLSVESGTSKAGKEWQKQSFLVDTGSQYNPEVCFQLFGEEKIQMLSHHNEGDQIEVSFNLSSREKFCQKNSTDSFRISTNCSFEQLFDRKPSTDVYLCCSFIIFFI